MPGFLHGTAHDEVAPGCGARFIRCFQAEGIVSFAQRKLLTEKELLGLAAPGRLAIDRKRGDRPQIRDLTFQIDGFVIDGLPVLHAGELNHWRLTIATLCHLDRHGV